VGEVECREGRVCSPKLDCFPKLVCLPKLKRAKGNRVLGKRQELKLYGAAARDRPICWAANDS